MVSVSMRFPKIAVVPTRLIETSKRDAVRLIPENACALTNQSGQVLSPLAPSEGSEQDVYIYDCTDCIIDLRHVPVAAMHLRNIHRCVILSGLGSGSLLGHSIKESVLVIGCKQVLQLDK